VFSVDAPVCCVMDGHTNIFSPICWAEIIGEHGHTHSSVRVLLVYCTNMVVSATIILSLGCVVLSVYHTVYPGSPVVYVDVCGDDRMATNFSNNPCLADGGSGMDTTWMDTQCVREGGGDGGDTLYELQYYSRVVATTMLPTCVSSGTEWNELDSSSIDRTWVRMCDVLHGMRSMI